MGWQRTVFYGAVGWTALLLALVVYLFFLIISGQPADGLSFAIVAGLGGVLGVLGMIDRLRGLFGTSPRYQARQKSPP